MVGQGLIRRLGGAGRKLTQSVTGGEALPSLHDAATRALAIRSDSAAAAADPEFSSLVLAGDAARDNRDWGGAENQYFRALERHPFQSGYRIQYAHMAKEQGKFELAELHYRSAVAEGAPSYFVDEHLAFVAQRNGSSFVRSGEVDLNVSELEAPPTAYDISTLAWLLWHMNEVDPVQGLRLIRTCRTNQDLLIAMTADERFVRRNALFLEMLRG